MSAGFARYVRERQRDNFRNKFLPKRGIALGVDASLRDGRPPFRSQRPAISCVMSGALHFGLLPDRFSSTYPSFSAFFLSKCIISICDIFLYKNKKGF